MRAALSGIALPVLAFAIPHHMNAHQRRMAMLHSLVGVHPKSSSFVVLGAHAFGTSGESNDDPLLVEFAQRWPWAQVLLVEASPFLATNLSGRLDRTRYKASAVRVRNAAVCPSGSAKKTMKFHTLTARLRDGRLPSYIDQTGSFNRSNMEPVIATIAKSFLRGDLKTIWTPAKLMSTIVATDVKCIPLAQLVPASTAVLVLDVEGLDCKLITSLDLCQLRLRIITFEAHNTEEPDCLAAYAHLWRGCSDYRHGVFEGPFVAKESRGNVHFFLNQTTLDRL